MSGKVFNFMRTRRTYVCDAWPIFNQTFAQKIDEPTQGGMSYLNRLRDFFMYINLFVYRFLVFLLSFHSVGNCFFFVYMILLENVTLIL